MLRWHRFKNVTAAIASTQGLLSLVRSMLQPIYGHHRYKNLTAFFLLDHYCCRRVTDITTPNMSPLPPFPQRSCCHLYKNVIPLSPLQIVAGFATSTILLLLSSILQCFRCRRLNNETALPPSNASLNRIKNVTAIMVQTL